MRRLNKMSAAEVRAYNLRDNGTNVTHFDVAQPERVQKARELIEEIIEENPGRTLTIWELGCSSGDIAGYFSEKHTVIGVDVVPAACVAASTKWPFMEVMQSEAEDFEPAWCDILVLCEFLEHIVDPIKLVMAWGPLAANIIVGHPLVGDGSDPEHGHVWAYDHQDFADWFHLAKHQLIEAWTFPMAGYEHMIIGRGRRT